jgi:oxygen-dependent protoporphyrinogen oxidase
MHVIVVGAGVAGLSAAFRLQQPGYSVTVLEAAQQVGGKTMASRQAGFILNRGATLIGASYDAVLKLAHEVDVDAEIISAPSTVGIVREGRPHWIRTKGIGLVTDFLRTPLLSFKSKLLLSRAGLDMLKARGKSGFGEPRLRADLDTESVGEYCDRRLNKEIRDRLLDPVMGGLLIIDGLRASVADLYFLSSKVLAGGMLGYRGGIDFLAKAVADRLDVQTSASVTNVSAEGDGVRVTWCQDGSVHERHVDGVVLSVAASEVTKLYPAIPESLRRLLDSIPQANIISIRLALKARPDNPAAIALVPKNELGGLAMIMLEHNLSPDIAPPGGAVIGALLYHEWCTPRLDNSDEELLAETLPDLEVLFPGISQQIETAEISRWTPGATRSEAGIHRMIAELDDAVASERRKIQFAGDYFNAPTINSSVVSGERAAIRLADALNARSAK